MKIKAKLESGKVALVTGGSSGIGKAIANELSKRGMHVWLVAEREELLESAGSEVETHRQNQDQKIGIISADVSNLEQVQMAVKQVTAESGPVDLLVNSAGITYPGYIQDIDLQIYKRMMDVDYFGTVYMVKAVLPTMIDRGSGYILNISSVAGYLALFGYSAYGASKFAVRGFTDALRQEMKLHGIGVSIIYPSDTKTPQLEYENKFKPAETKALANLGNPMTPEAVAKKVIKGIERGQYRIIPGLDGKFWIRLSELSFGFINLIADSIVAGAYKKKNSTHMKEA